MDKLRDKSNQDIQKTAISSLIAELTCNDVVRCQKARKALVSIGKPAVAPLAKALTDPKEQVRWEAAKALGQIADPSAIGGMLKAMEEDKDFDVRWVAAEGLAAIGRDSLVPLLKAMITHSDSNWFRSGAYHIVHNLAGRGFYQELRPVLVALEDSVPYVGVPIAAEIALNKLRGK